jgi:glycosyltransferase involved in cell wall biosynthesis
MHVVMTVNAAWNIWNFRRPLVEALLADGHRVTVVAPEDDAVRDLTQMGCDFVPLTMSVQGLNPLKDLWLIARMRRIFSKAKPDVILSYTIKNNIFGALAAKTLGIPFFPNVTGLGTAFLSRTVLRLLVEGLYRAAFKSLPVIFFQNSDDRDLFVTSKMVRERQAALLPGSGIDLTHFAPAEFPEIGPPVFLMIARLLRDKGVYEFVEAARLVREKHPEATFQLLGAAGAKNRTAIDLDTVRDWQQSHGIVYLGTTTDVRKHIAAAHCIVLPSYREGAPRTLLEAASMARPLIATDVPGCRTVLENGSTGFLCRPRDAQSLATACLEFLELTPIAQKKMGLLGRVKMEREFCQSVVVGAYRKALLGIGLGPFAQSGKFVRSAEHSSASASSE